MNRRTRTVVELCRGALGATYVVGAGVHLGNWLWNPSVYESLSQFVLFGWYRALWSGLVLPNLAFLLPLLAVFELALGFGILGSGRRVRLGLAVGGLFNLGLAPLGFWWPSNVALAAGQFALLRYEYPDTSFDRMRRWVRRRGIGTRERRGFER